MVPVRPVGMKTSCKRSIRCLSSNWRGNLLCVVQITTVQIINVQSSELPVFFSSSGSFLRVRAAEVVSVHFIASSVTVSYGANGLWRGGELRSLGWLLGQFHQSDPLIQCALGPWKAWVFGKIDY